MGKPASMPSKPRTCHQRSPPTSLSRLSRPNHSMRRSAAWLQLLSGMIAFITIDHGGEGMWVLVLEWVLDISSWDSKFGAQSLQWLDIVECTNVYEFLHDMKCSFIGWATCDHCAANQSSLVVKNVLGRVIIPLEAGLFQFLVKMTKECGDNDWIINT